MREKSKEGETISLDLKSIITIGYQEENRN